VTGVHHALDLFVQSSDYEGTPNAVLEAMALGAPVVATNVGGTGELIADGVHGRLIPPGDAGALTTAIDWALGDPSTARAMARAARAKIEQELSFERRMQRVEGIYRELAPPRSRSALTHRAPSLP
jgi:glycosyltransferase involved in cell wall biosynthesis